MIDPDTLLARVAEAFPSEPVPPKDELFNGHCCECVEVSDAFGYKAWAAVSLDELRAGGETALLSPTAWRYYLPAVMTWCVRAPDEVEVIQDNLVYQLEPPSPADDPGLQQWFFERMKGFSLLQRQAILGYLDWYRERQEAEYARLAMEPPGNVYRALEYWTRDQTPAEPGGAG
jgi:hypothetical protein